MWFQNKCDLSMVAHACNSIRWKAEAGGYGAQL